MKIKDFMHFILKHFGQLISEKVGDKNQKVDDLSKRDTYGKAFLQIFNLWTENKEIQKFIFSKRLAKIATELMQVEGVRMYHDQALFKESSGGYTPWHADQYYWPLSSDKTVTAWIPLQKIDAEMGPLEFSAGSQAISEGRSLAISDESEEKIEKRLRVTDFIKVSEPFELGEVSFHHNLSFHTAPENKTTQSRIVLANTYFADGARVVSNPTMISGDWKKFIPATKPGEIVSSNLNPICWPTT